MKYISTVDMPRDEWLALRLNSIGSSDAPAVLGLSKWKSPLDVYLEKTGINQPTEDNLRMKFGREAEPMIARWFEEKTGLKVVNDFKVRYHGDYPFLSCSIDRVIQSSNGIGTGLLEIKTVSEAAYKHWEERIPLYYFAQEQHQLGITGWSYGYFAILVIGFTGIQAFEVFKFQRDDDYIQSANEKLVDFWNNNVVPRVPPEPITEADLKILHPTSEAGKSLEAVSETIEVIERLRSVKKRIKDLDQEKKDLETEIKLAMKDAEVLSRDGEVLATWKTAKERETFDKKKLQADHPDLYSQYVEFKPGYRRFLVK